MASSKRDNLVQPEWMDDEQWAFFKEATSSLERIRGDSKADIEKYLESPQDWVKAETSPSGFPTLLLTMIGRKSGEKRTTPLVFMQNGEDMIVVGSLAGYDNHPVWVLNLDADPNCWVQCGTRKMTAVARDASDEERAELWPRLVETFPAWGYFQGVTERPFSIKILSPTGPA